MRQLFLTFTFMFMAGAMASNDECHFQKVLEATEQRMAAPQVAAVQEESWTMPGNDLSFSIKANRLTLSGTKHEIGVNATLSPEEVRFLRRYTQNNSSRFDRDLSKDENLRAAKSAVDHAKLHAAFYGEGARPIDAANELKRLVTRSSSYNPYLKVTVSEAPTQKERMEGISQMATALEGMAELHRRGRLERVIGEVREEQEAEAGRRILGQILGNTPEVSLYDVIAATEAAQRRRDPPAVEIKFEYSHGDPRVIHIERAPNGRLRVQADATSGFKVTNLKGVVNWTQGEGFSGKDHDWRTYEDIDATPFQ